MKSGEFNLKELRLSLKRFYFYDIVCTIEKVKEKFE